MLTLPATCLLDRNTYSHDINVAGFSTADSKSGADGPLVNTAKNPEDTPPRPESPTPSEMKAKSPQDMREFLAQLHPATIIGIQGYSFLKAGDDAHIPFYTYNHGGVSYPISIWLGVDPLVECESWYVSPGFRASPHIFRLRVDDLHPSVRLPQRVARVGQLAVRLRAAMDESDEEYGSDGFYYSDWELFIDVDSSKMAVWAIAPADPDINISDDDDEAVAISGIGAVLTDRVENKAVLFLDSIHDLGRFEATEHTDIVEKAFNALREASPIHNPRLALVLTPKDGSHRQA